jgi:hypothetical protein
LANLPGFGTCLLISCAAVACRPLRFRSRFIAIALCIAPQLFYWGYFGGARAADPLKWGFSFAPWICAWLDCLIIAGVVLIVGHYTRYRPGLVLLFVTLTLVITVGVFEASIGFDELDYQLYVAKNNPELVDEFHDHKVTEALDEAITNQEVGRYLREFYYSAAQPELRAELKKLIQNQMMSYDRWPSWFNVPQGMEYKAKKDWLLSRYDLFIAKRPNSKRMPIALYFKALLSEYSPDIRAFGEKELLHFYSDYPQERSADIWWKLYWNFSSSPESLEARWRIAKHWACWGRFEQADKVLAEAQTMTAERLKIIEARPEKNKSFFEMFQTPADSVMTAPKLNDLQRRIYLLRTLIGPENLPYSILDNPASPEKQKEKLASEERLKEFVAINPHLPDYPQNLQDLLTQAGNNDPLSDNIKLAQTELIDDEQLKIEHLTKLYEQYPQTDGGIQALYELGLLKISLWRQQEPTNAELKKKYLEQARASLTSFINLCPNSFYAEQVKKNLEVLPKAD